MGVTWIVKSRPNAATSDHSDTPSSARCTRRTVVSLAPKASLLGWPTTLAACSLTSGSAPPSIKVTTPAASVSHTTTGSDPTMLLRFAVRRSSSARRWARSSASRTMAATCSATWRSSALGLRGMGSRMSSVARVAAAPGGTGWLQTARRLCRRRCAAYARKRVSASKSGMTTGCSSAMASAAGQPCAWMAGSAYRSAMSAGRVATTPRSRPRPSSSTTTQKVSPAIWRSANRATSRRLSRSVAPWANWLRSARCASSAWVRAFCTSDGRRTSPATGWSGAASARPKAYRMPSNRRLWPCQAASRSSTRGGGASAAGCSASSQR